MPDIAVFMSFAKPALSQTNMKRVPIACYFNVSAIFRFWANRKMWDLP